MAHRCRLDDQYFPDAGTCHVHVDRKHEDWGYAVCEEVTFACKVCQSEFDDYDKCADHIAQKHAESEGRTAQHIAKILSGDSAVVYQPENSSE